MSVDLPGPLRAAIDAELQGVSRKGLAERAARTSAAYRAGAPSSGVIREADDALAYALTRLPATYAACARVFEELDARAPDFRPTTLLDAGSGTAAASWAATEAWGGLSGAVWLDSSPPFLSLAERLAQGGPQVLRDADRRRADLVGGGPWPTSDLVVASYALAEIPADRQAEVIAALWAATEGVLALVEPGTPAGYGRILAARDILTAAGATLIGPCARQGACPLTPPDWCHFSVRLPRSRDHRIAKGAEVPFEDERFIYLLAARPGIGAPAEGRVLAPPRQGKPGIDLKLCTPDGLEQRFVPRRDKAAYGVVKRLDWGDALQPR